MNQPQEQRAQYGGRSIRMHLDNASGDEGTVLELPRRRSAPLQQEQSTPSRPSGEQPQARPRRAAPPVFDELDNHALYEQRIPSSSRRYTPVAVPQGQTRLRVQHHSAPPIKRRVSQDFPFQAQQPSHAPRPQPRSGANPHKQRHVLVIIGSTAAGVILSLSALHAALSWWTTTQDDWTYGRPRTSQTDAVVGHNDGPGDPSHFTVENFNRHVVVIEFQGGDPSKAVTYIGPTLMGAGQDLTPVMVSFRDVNQDHKPDMILTIDGSHTVFVNTGKAFRPATPADHIIL